MRTTITIDKHIAERVSEHAKEAGYPSMKSLAEFLLRKSCDFIETQGYDEFIKIPTAANNAVVQASK